MPRSRFDTVTLASRSRHSGVSVSSLRRLGLDIIRLIYNCGSHKQYLQVMQSRVAAQTVLVTTDIIFL